MNKFINLETITNKKNLGTKCVSKFWDRLKNEDLGIKEIGIVLETNRNALIEAVYDGKNFTID